jgi:C4-dicarboxylate-specific signal transduction histidine kinase
LHQEGLESTVLQRTDDIRKLNEELLASNDELYHVNELLYKQKNDLTVTLDQLKNAQDQIILSEKMASLGTLSAGIAHEINNPLNFIQGGILAIEAYLGENLKEHAIILSPMVNAVNVGVQRSASIVASLNRYSRSDSNSRADCNINFIIDNCITILGIQLKNRIDVRKNFTNAGYTLQGNEGKLHQAFLNILSNASQSIE